jgi:hypothetical protein
VVQLFFEYLLIPAEAIVGLGSEQPLGDSYILTFYLPALCEERKIIILFMSIYVTMEIAACYIKVSAGGYM